HCRLLACGGLICLTAWAAADTPAEPAVNLDRVRAAVKYLSSDRLEGRGIGTRGEELATEYIAQEFEKAGLTPAGERGTFFQAVPLLRVATSPEATLAARAGDQTVDFRCGQDFGGQSH